MTWSKCKTICLILKKRRGVGGDQSLEMISAGWLMMKKSFLFLLEEIPFYRMVIFFFNFFLSYNKSEPPPPRKKQSNSVPGGLYFGWLVGGTYVV